MSIIASQRKGKRNPNTVTEGEARTCDMARAGAGRDPVIRPVYF